MSTRINRVWWHYFLQSRNLRPRCKATTSIGQRCQRQAWEGEDYCGTHRQREERR